MFRIYDWNFSGTADLATAALLLATLMVVVLV